jgi:SAM-dependent methyltransferase
VSLRDLWDRQASVWGRYVRTPGHDTLHERLNLPAFLELLPPPPARTLDVGCGEGRVGAELVARGYDVVGVDSSPGMVALAQERHEALVADAAALPFEDERFDLVLAYMSLMNMDDLEGAVRESARVLRGGGTLCAAVLHPLFAASDPDPDGVAVRIADYFSGRTKVWTDERDGIAIEFHDRAIPLERYVDALAAAGLLVERVREVASTRRPIPIVLQLRAVKP